MNDMTVAIMISLRLMTETFVQQELGMGRSEGEYSPELKAALAQLEMLEQGLLSVEIVE